MGLIVSLILIAAGAILIWAVTAEVAGLSIDAVGWVLLIVGVIAFLLTLILWSPWSAGGGRYSRRREYVEDTGVSRRVVERPRREVIVEEDDVAPGPPPP